MHLSQGAGGSLSTPVSNKRKSADVHDEEGDGGDGANGDDIFRIAGSERKKRTCRAAVKEEVPDEELLGEESVEEADYDGDDDDPTSSNYRVWVCRNKKRQDTRKSPGYHPVAGERPRLGAPPTSKTARQHNLVKQDLPIRTRTS